MADGQQENKIAIEKELTCSVGDLISLLALTTIVLRERGSMLASGDPQAAALPRRTTLPNQADLLAGTLADLARSAPTLYTNRSRFSTAIIPSVAHA